MDYFIVELHNDKQIAIPLDQVQEVMSINYIDICPIPGVKDSLLGVINQKGNLLWLVDLSRLLYDFYSLNNAYTSLTILVTKLEYNYIGLVVKKLGEIKNLVMNNNLSISSNNNPLLLNINNSIAILDLIKVQHYLN